MTESFENRITVEFLVSSPDWTTQHLADAIGIEPDRRYDKPPHLANLHNIVSYASGLPETTGFTEQVLALLTRLEPVRRRVSEMVENGFVATKLRVSGEVSEGVDLVLPRQQVALMGDLGVSLSFSAVYHESAAYYRALARRNREERLRRQDRPTEPSF